MSLPLLLRWIFLLQPKTTEMIKREVMAGDTFSLVYKHKPEGVLTDMPDAYNLMIGLHTEGGSKVETFSYQDGDFEPQTETGVYRWTIKHELSKNLKGTVIAEMVLYSRDLSFVQHCGEPIKLTVIPSLMNEEIENE